MPAMNDLHGFEPMTPSDHRAWLWVVSLLSLTYSFLCLGARLTGKWDLLWWDDAVLGLAYVRSIIVLKIHGKALTDSRISGVRNLSLGHSVQGDINGTWSIDTGNIIFWHRICRGGKLHPATTRTTGTHKHRPGTLSWQLKGRKQSRIDLWPNIRRTNATHLVGHARCDSCIMLTPPDSTTLPQGSSDLWPCPPARSLS